MESFINVGRAGASNAGGRRSSYSGRKTNYFEVAQRKEPQLFLSCLQFKQLGDWRPPFKRDGIPWRRVNNRRRILSAIFSCLPELCVYAQFYGSTSSWVGKRERDTGKQIINEPERESRWRWLIISPYRLNKKKTCSHNPGQSLVFRCEHRT